MTNDEAITNLNMIRVAFVEPVTKEQRKLIDDTFEMAIKALEQQPCDDAISRQAVLERAINVPIAKIVTNDKVICRKVVFVDDIENLPPVTPQQKYGKWIKHPEIETSTPEYLMFYECSECGDKQCFCKSDLHKKRFCNSCGVKMQESEE